MIQLVKSLAPKASILTDKRPSVKKELDEIKNRNKKAKPKQTVRQRNRVRHKQPQRKKKIKRKVR